MPKTFWKTKYCIKPYRCVSTQFARQIFDLGPYAGQVIFTRSTTKFPPKFVALKISYNRRGQISITKKHFTMFQFTFNCWSSLNPLEPNTDSTLKCFPCRLELTWRGQSVCYTPKFYVMLSLNPSSFSALAKFFFPFLLSFTFLHVKFSYNNISTSLLRLWNSWSWMKDRQTIVKTRSS